MPRQYDVLASIGTGGPTATTLNEHVLRPSIGVRLLVVGIAGAILLFILRPDLAPDGFHEAMPEQHVHTLQFLLLLAGVNGVFYIFTFETRYDRDALITTRMMFFRREFLWKNLTRVADDEAYELHLFFDPGGKAKVLKHSVGIADFKTFALAQIQKNRSAHA